MWHKRFTPWFTEDQCVVLAKSYWTDSEKDASKKKSQKKKDKETQDEKSEIQIKPA